jgi:arginyl-tRNA synthetase
MPPPACAEELAKTLVLPAGIERSQVVGPYLNFFVERKTFAKEVLARILSGGSPLKVAAQKKKFIVEYSSPNIAKPFHIGHLRTTLIGHSIDRILRSLGHEVISVNHLGDWGTQFGFVYAGCKLWGRPAEENIFELVDMYVRASALRRAQEEKTVPAEDLDKPDVNQMARDYFLKLEADDPEATEFWQWCLDISLKYLKDLYQRLGVHFDHYTGESFYRKKLGAVEKMLRESGILEDSRGALGVDLGKQLGFARVFTEDLATADYRHKTYAADKILYVVGAPQSQYFKQLIEIFKRMKHPVGDTMVHVSYGNVPGISTRKSSGKDDRIWLHSLLDEAHERALEAYRSQVVKKADDGTTPVPAVADEETLAEAVGLGAIFFNYLCRTNVKEFNFSWEEALSFQGDTGPYVQYAVARINSIEAKAAQTGITPLATCDTSALTDDSAHQVMSLLSRFQDVVELSAEDYEPNHVASYVLDLAKSFSGAYRNLRVIGEPPEVAAARLTLFRAVKDTLKVGLGLIGVPVVERM